MFLSEKKGMSTEDLYNTPIQVTDVMSMMTHDVKANEQPYTAAAITATNKMVADWRSDILDKQFDTGIMKTGSVIRMCNLYTDGIFMEKYAKLREDGLIVDSPHVEFWRTFFEKSSINTMMAAGTTAVSHGWSVIKNHFKILNADYKYKNFFSIHTTPLDREKHAASSRDALADNQFDFWNKDTYEKFKEKVSAVLLFNPDFEKVPVKDIITADEITKALLVTNTNNMRPFQKLCVKRNNALVVDFCAFLHKNIEEDISSEMSFKLWGLYCDGIQVKKYIVFEARNKDMLIPNDSVFSRWLDILGMPVEELARYGPATVEYGHCVFREYLQDNIVRSKFDFYSHPEKQWLDVSDDFDRIDCSGITLDKISDVNSRVVAVLKNIVHPK